jgi:hypothetical protein
MTKYAPMVKWCKEEGYKSEVTSIIAPHYPVATPIASITSTPPSLSTHCPVLRTTARQDRGPSACLFAIQARLFQPGSVAI